MIGPWALLRAAQLCFGSAILAIDRDCRNGIRRAPGREPGAIIDLQPLGVGGLPARHGSVGPNRRPSLRQAFSCTLSERGDDGFTLVSQSQKRPPPKAPLQN